MQIFLFKNQTLGDILGPWRMGCNVGIAHAASENEKSEYSLPKMHCIQKVRFCFNKDW